MKKNPVDQVLVPYTLEFALLLMSNTYSRMKMQIALINNRKPFQKMISRPLLSRAISNNI